MQILWNIGTMFCKVDIVHVLDTVIAVLGCGGYTSLPKSITDHAHIASVAILAPLFSHTVCQCWRTSEVMLPLVEVATILWHAETTVSGMKGLVNWMCSIAGRASWRVGCASLSTVKSPAASMAPPL
jgi:hypothetical protein